MKKGSKKSIPIFSVLKVGLGLAGWFFGLMAKEAQKNNNEENSDEIIFGPEGIEEYHAVQTYGLDGANFLRGHD